MRKTKDKKAIIVEKKQEEEKKIQNSIRELEEFYVNGKVNNLLSEIDAKKKKRRISKRYDRICQRK